MSLMIAINDRLCTQKYSEIFFLGFETISKRSTFVTLHLSGNKITEILLFLRNFHRGEKYCDEVSARILKNVSSEKNNSFGLFLIHARGDLHRDLCAAGGYTLNKSNPEGGAEGFVRALFPCSFALCSIFICLALYVRVIYRATKHCSQFSLRINSTACTRNDRYRYNGNAPRRK